MLLWLWRVIVGGCAHRWTVKHESLIYDRNSPVPDRPSGIAFIQHCERCGAVRRKDV